jgi:prepilin-type N-terminal cleavage/methylation domain-containing protein
MRKGFTLIEVSVVIVVVALMAAIAFPRLQQMAASQRAANSIDGIERLLRQGREEAVRRQAFTRIVVRGSSLVLSAPDQLPLDEQLPAPEDEGGDPIDPDRELGQIISSAQLAEGAALAAFQLNGSESDEAEWSAGFYADGAASASGLEIDLLGRRISFIVDPTSGAVARIEGAMPLQQSPKWEAGQIEQRL